MNSLRTSKTELIAELQAAGATVKGSAILCPFHPDKNPSGGVFQGDDSVWRFKCHSCGAGGDIFDVRAMRTGKPLADILQNYTQDMSKMKNTRSPLPRAGKKPFTDLPAIYAVLAAKHGGTLEALHEYQTLDESPNQFIVRWRGRDEKKYIWPVLKTQTGYHLEFSEHRILYRLPSLAQADTVIICEGEKKCDVLARYGFAATTSAGGSKAASKTDWKPLAGKSVILWPDYDTAGQGYRDDVKRILDRLGCRIKTIDPAQLDLAESEDAADYIAQLKIAGFDDFQIKENLIQVFAKAKSTGPASEVVQHIGGIISGKYVPLETGFSCLDAAMQILPGSLNLVCGSPGSSKSLLLLQLAAKWYKAGIKTPIYELEKDRTFHLRRGLAQESGLAAITSNRWVLENPETAQRTAAEHLDFLDGFGHLIFATPEKMIFQRDIVEWVQQRADTGCRAVIIDPTSKAERTDEPYKADGAFVQQLASIATMTRLVIFLVLHPSKTVVAMPDLAMISGGAAYSRFSDNAIWLESHDSKTSMIKTSCGTIEETHDRTVWILKSRDGGGTGSRLAYRFNKDNLTLSEIGQIQPGKKNKNKF